MRHSFLPLFGFLALSALPLAAQTVTTTPVGFVTGTVAGGGSISTPKLSLLSPTLVRPTLWQGAAASVSSTTITVSGSQWSAGQFSGTNGRHYVEIISGSNSGAWSDITASGTNTLTVADNLTPFVSGTVNVAIRKHTTISDMFGATNTAGLLAGPEPAASDEVLVYTGASATTYWYHDGSQGPAGWYDVSYNPAGDTVIAPSQGVVVKHKASGAVSVKMLGTVKTGTTFLPISTNLNVIGTIYPGDLTLDASNLYTGDSVTGVKAGSEPATSDRITIYTSNSQSIYWYHDGSQGPAGWYDVSYNASGSVVIPAGSSIVLDRKSPGTAFNWKVPGPTL